MLRFRTHVHVGPFVWSPSRRRRSRVPSMPWVTMRVVALFALGLAASVMLVRWLS